MDIVDLIIAALKSLRSNILRTALTALGMIIGVAAVIIVVAIGAGAQAGIQSVIDSIGANMLMVTGGSSNSRGVQQGAGTRQTLTWADSIAIQEEISGVKVSTPVVRSSMQIIFGNSNWRARVEGTTPEYFDPRGWALNEGRIFDDQEVRSGKKVAVIGETILENLFKDQDPIGQIIRIDRVPFEVIGTLKAKGQSTFGQDQDDVLFVPLSAAQQRLIRSPRSSPDGVQMILVFAHSADQVSTVERKIEELLRDRHKIASGATDDFAIRNISEFLEARAESGRLMAILLAAVAAVSLLVGGIGIMNIMLVSVTERTREIGIRMAVGANRKDVLSQFLLEAVAISMLGGIIGIIIGIISSQVTANLADWPLELDIRAILLAFGFSATVGIFFGYYPARKAARLDPIEALRYE